ncbi:MAG: type II toxin-antitoxin system PemK/MazF family toxin [Symploca sp. SIO2D2]|nr:type II toxin-antitoxin system PemK/MazF family toxin [Symploca sp. SIO2D2]
MKRGNIYDARLDPTQGSEQAGNRPVIIVSRNAISAASSVVLAVPCTTYRQGRRIYPSQVLIKAPEGGLTRDSIALAEQVRVLSKERILQHRGKLSEETLRKLDRALAIALDLEKYSP